MVTGHMHKLSSGGLEPSLSALSCILQSDG